MYFFRNKLGMRGKRTDNKGKNQQRRQSWAEEVLSQIEDEDDDDDLLDVIEGKFDEDDETKNAKKAPKNRYVRNIQYT